MTEEIKLHKLSQTSVELHVFCETCETLEMSDHQKKKKKKNERRQEPSELVLRSCGQRGKSLLLGPTPPYRQHSGCLFFAALCNNTHQSRCFTTSTHDASAAKRSKEYRSGKWGIQSFRDIWQASQPRRSDQDSTLVWAVSQHILTPARRCKNI